MVLYEHVDGQVTLYAVTTEIGSPIKSVSRPVKNYLRLNSLDQMMYLATLNIPRYP